MRVFFPILLGLFLAAGQSQASSASDAAAFQASLEDNLKAGSGYLADVFGKGLAFAVGSQGFSPVEAKGLLHFNLGLSGGIGSTAIDKSAVKSQALNNGTDLSGLANGLPATLAIPLGSLNAHVGLPKLLFFESADLGVRGTQLDLATADLSAKISGLGVEFRGNVFEAGLVSPLTLTLGFAWETLNSELHGVQAVAATSGSFGASSYSGSSKYRTDLESSLSAATLKASVSRKLLFLTPYAGVAFNYISGETRFRSAHEGSLTFDDGGTPYVLSGVIEGVATRPAPAVDLRVGGGLELSLFALYLAAGAEYGVVSGGSGAHAQVGLAF